MNLLHDPRSLNPSRLWSFSFSPGSLFGQVFNLNPTESECFPLCDSHLMLHNISLFIQDKPCNMRNLYLLIRLNVFTRKTQKQISSVVFKANMFFVYLLSN